MDLIKSMRTFVEIVDRGSLTAAAEVLDRSQPTVVRTLANLEEQLNARLLNRTTRRISLTPEGRDYLERCRCILADIEDAELAVGQQRAEPRGDLRITAPVLFGEMHVAPVLMEFLRKYDQVRAELLLFDRNVDLVDEGLDLAVRIGKLPDSSMVATHVGEVARQVCVSPAYLKSAREPLHPGHLAEMPCIRFNGLASPGTWRFEESGREIAVHVNGPLSCNHLGVARTACLDGQGFGQFLSYQVAPFLRDRSLVRVLGDYEPEPLPVSLVYPGGRLVSARLRALIDWLKASLLH